MNKIKYLIVFLFCLCPLWAVGQNQVASGTVSDDLGPLMGVYVGEIDAANRIVSAAVTDMNGHFTLKVQNPKNKLRFTYMGYKTVLQEIGKRAVFDIMMEENSKVMKEVVVEARPKIATGGLEIPEREQSFAQQTIKMTEFEGLSFTSAGRIPVPMRLSAGRCAPNCPAIITLSSSLISFPAFLRSA